MTPAPHLTPEHLEAAQRHLIAKAIAEFAHERLLAPAPTPDGRWRVASRHSAWTFAARRHALEHWAVSPDSLERTRDGRPAPLDVLDLVAELDDVLGIPDDLLTTYLEELACTLAAGCWKRAADRPTAAELVHAGWQDIEAAMTEGHPGFVANNGRVGFALDDYLRYAPETGATLRLLWVAARREHTHLALGRGRTEQELYAGELGDDELARFAATLTDLGLDPAAYLYLPVHPWQWVHKLSLTLAPDVARRDLVLLGEGRDAYRPQQSVRTLCNVDHPRRHFVKTAVAISNMGFVRGLSPAYMAATPAINDWVHDLVEGDPELAACGFRVLREVASVGYSGDAFHRLAKPSSYRTLAAALWRESPLPLLADGERLATMASLLHRDAKGTSVVAELVAASGLDATAWVRAYLRAYVRPVVHCLLAHDLAFMPHGENLVLVLRDHVVTGALMKDIGEEVAVMHPTRPLPPDIERIRADVDPDVRALSFLTDVVDGVLRHLAVILDADGVLAESAFWALVADTVREHAADHPELGPAAAAYDLLRPAFAHSCLNRLQLRNTVHMVDISDQAGSLMYAGTLDNPLADPLAPSGG